MKLLLNKDQKNILKKHIITNFFENPNNENIYKLFIYASALTNNGLKYYNNSNSNIDLLTYSKKLSPINNLHNNIYIFYYNNEFQDNNKMCSTITNKDDCNNMSQWM